MLSFMRPFRCPVTILNTIDHLGKFDGKADEGFFVGYSTNSKAFGVFNSRTRIVEENLHSNGNAGEEEKKDAEDPGNESGNPNCRKIVSSTVNVAVTEIDDDDFGAEA
ncbi:retrovirus-related pol polyprotein from transposon TNT 1-94 [Tanacetum coccineum]